MFRAISFVRDASTAADLQILASQADVAIILRNVLERPKPHEVVFLLNSLDPDLIFVELSDPETATALSEYVRQHFPKVAVVGFGGAGDPALVEQLYAAGLAGILDSPVTAESLKRGVQRAIRRVRNAVQENLIALLPGKAGCGCTTTVFNTAGRLAEFGYRVLVLESDLNSGVLSVQLNLRPEPSILDALEHASELSSTSWFNWVHSKHDIDWLLASRSRPLPEWAMYHQLLEFSQDRYDFVLVDLPEVVNEATAEIFHRAKYMFVVSTPERPALTLARRRFADLDARGVPADRTGVVLNRCQDVVGVEDEAEDWLHRGVAAILPNDYPAVVAASEKSKFVDPDVPLGRAYLKFARRIAGLYDEELDDLPQKRSKLAIIKSAITGRT